MEIFRASSLVDHDRASKFVDKVVTAFKEQRQLAEVSQYRLAELTGLSREAIRLIENGQRSPTLHSLFLMSSSLGIDLAAILGDLENCE